MFWILDLDFFFFLENPHVNNGLFPIRSKSRHRLILFLMLFVMSSLHTA